MPLWQTPVKSLGANYKRGYIQENGKMHKTKQLLAL